jgi:hypothetical protein
VAAGLISGSVGNATKVGGLRASGDADATRSQRNRVRSSIRRSGLLDHLEHEPSGHPVVDQVAAPRAHLVDYLAPGLRRRIERLSRRRMSATSEHRRPVGNLLDPHPSCAESAGITWLECRSYLSPARTAWSASSK